MRLFSFLLLCCTTSGLFAQKAPAAKPAAAKSSKPAAEKINPVNDSVPLTEKLVFAKLGKTKVTAHFLKTFPSPQLGRNKEVLYFLYEHFDEKQVQRIIALSESRTMATSAGYDSVMKRGDAFTAYLVKPYRHIWPSDSTKFTEMALLYIPFSEKENFNNLYTIQPATTEGVFVSADYTVLETETMAKLPPVPKWEQRSLFSLPNYKATHKEEPKPVAVVTPVTNTEKPSPVQQAKYTLQDLLTVSKKITEAAEKINLLTDILNDAMANKFKGPGNTVTEATPRAARDIKNYFNSAMILFADTKQTIGYVKEDRLTGTVCDNTYYIYKAKEKVNSSLVDIIFEKDFLKTYIDIIQTDASASYSLWIDNMKNFQRRYKERMLQYVQTLADSRHELTVKCLACLEQADKK